MICRLIGRLVSDRSTNARKSVGSFDRLLIGWLAVHSVGVQLAIGRPVLSGSVVEFATQSESYRRMVGVRSNVWLFGYSEARLPTVGRRPAVDRMELGWLARCSFGRPAFGELVARSADRWSVGRSIDK